MKLVQTITNDILSREWCIYELNEEERKYFGDKSNFALSQGKFSDYALKNGSKALISRLDYYSYEGLFETQKEAYMQVKLVEMKERITRVHYAIKEMEKAKIMDDLRW